MIQYRLRGLEKPFLIQKMDFEGSKSVFWFWKMDFEGSKSIFWVREMDFEGSKAFAKAPNLIKYKNEQT